MATCKQIGSMLQARIDGELGPAEGVIVDQHLAECAACASQLRSQQRTAAALFEIFGPYRLQKDLSGGVMEHLPEMKPLRIDVEGVNWRAKTPSAHRAWWVAFVPAVAALILLCLALPIYFFWPKAPESVGVIGVITSSAGAVKCTPSYGNADPAAATASTKGLVACGNRYETGPGSRMMLSLRGPTHLKLEENTRVHVFDDRGLSVDTGRVHLDVAKDVRPFTVNTPFSTITVLGTVFEILVDSQKTTITLKSGKIRYENDVSQSELLPEEQVIVTSGDIHPMPHKVDAAGVMQWADAIVPDQNAYNLFTKEIQPKSAAELPGEEVFAIVTTRQNVARPIAAVFFSWQPDGFSSGHCSYEVRICNEAMVELFKTRIDASVFADKSRNTYQVDVPGEPIRNAGVLHVKLVPDFSSGDVMASFTKVWALGI